MKRLTLHPPPPSSGSQAEHRETPTTRENVSLASSAAPDRSPRAAARRHRQVPTFQPNPPPAALTLCSSMMSEEAQPVPGQNRYNVPRPAPAPQRMRAGMPSAARASALRPVPSCPVLPPRTPAARVPRPRPGAGHLGRRSRSWHTERGLAGSGGSVPGVGLRTGLLAGCLRRSRELGRACRCALGGRRERGVLEAGTSEPSVASRAAAGPRAAQRRRTPCCALQGGGAVRPGARAV